MKMKFALICVMVTVFNISLYAGSTGRLKGKVTDSKSKEEIIGANIILLGTNYGASTDLDGSFSINNINVGVYTATVSYIGYQKVSISNITIKIDQTYELNVQLKEETIELGQEIVVTAERPLIQKDLTSTSSVVSADEMKALPIESLGQVVGLQAGVVAGHFRGGRSNEVAYLVDGIPVNDGFNGGSGITVDTKAVEQLEVISGTFNAEYGSAMSGVVNAITKEGSQNFNSSFSYYYGNRYTFNDKEFRNLNNFSHAGSQDFQGSLSGPVVGNLTFFSTLRYQNDEGFLFGKRIFNDFDNSPLKGTDSGFLPPGAVLSKDLFNPTGDGKWVSMNPSKRVGFSGKLTYPLFDYGLKFNYGFNYENNFNKYYNHKYFLTPDGVKSHYRTQYMNNFEVTYVPTANTFFTGKVSYSRYDYKGYVYENPMDSRYQYVNSGIIPGGADAYSFYAGGQESDRYDRFSTNLFSSLKMTSQINDKHKLTAGIESKILNYYDHYMTLSSNIDTVVDIFPKYPDPGTSGNTSYNKKPYEISAYIQDKMEYDFMIVNIGLRLDYVNTNTNVPKSYSSIQLIETDSTAFVLIGDGLKKSTPQYQISPRLGISFPISDQGALHFSYGHFLMMPNYQDIYQNSDYLISQGSDPGILANGDIKPQKTISYELGLQQVVFNNISLEFTAYYRDIRNLITAEIEENINGSKIGVNRNTDYGNVKGLIFSMDKQFSDYYSAQLNYTYQLAEGTSSDRLQNYQNKLNDIITEKRILPLDWDQRSTLNVILTVGNPGDWTISSIFQYGTGTPYTPARDVRSTAESYRNEGTKPSTYNTDIRAEKRFEINGYSINTFLLIYNVFDTRNEYGVNGVSGRANNDPALKDYSGSFSPFNTAQEFINNPQSYSEPRNVKLGFSFEF